MKKVLFFLMLLPLLIILPACGKKDTMDRINKDGVYQYHNQDLGFGIGLPEEFLYYQVQRKNNEGYVGLDFFLPTNDKARQIEVPGYWKPVMVKIYDKEIFDNLSDNSDEKKMFNNMGEKNGKIYLLGFWQDTPDDWRENCIEGSEKRSSGYCWSEEVENSVKDAFYIM